MRACLLLLLLACAASADRWKRFLERQFVSPNGKHKLDAKSTAGNKLAWRLLEGGQPVAEGTAPQLPLEVFVLDARPAAVLFEKYANVGYGDTVSLLEKGGLVWRVPLSALFDKKTRAGFRRSVSSIWWHRAIWVDEQRGKLVVVSRGGRVREVELATGAVTTPQKGVILTGIRLAHARSQALELAAEFGLKGVAKLAAPLVADTKLPIGVRLRAAIAVQGAGGARVPKELFGAALEPTQSPKERRFAISKIPDVYGSEGTDLLEAAAGRRETAYDAVRALARLGAGGARTLASIIASGETRAAERGYASQALGKLPAAAVGRAILAEFTDADAPVAAALLKAGIAARVADLDKLLHPHEEVLIRVLQRDAAAVEWLADHFKALPSTQAVKPLLGALGRHARQPGRVRKLIDALKACTGLDYGPDPAAWQKALR